ncbi:MAG: ATP-dependent Clp protease ATP-binding subunit, partial [Candidatus Pacebacteria bacterium]|nr:ATP-dependent Clp protease ATP-binding subunit [Candidatus Paceibacterota bacterium]
ELESKNKSMEITLDDIAYVVEAWTGIPVQRLTMIETEKLLNLENRLHERIVGQYKAVTSLSKAIRRNRAGFGTKKKPSSFVFVGPTGVGKTELVKALADELFGSIDNLIRVDMSEYMEKHSVSKLVGSPPGYVGYDDAGQLTEKVRRKPYSVILFDEIEKAHPDVYNILLQIFEDGRLTDSQGRVVNFENTVIVMTSNAGNSIKAKGIGFYNDEYAVMEAKVNDVLKELFRPEFLNRIDEIIVFTELSKEELSEIFDLMLKDIESDVKEKEMTISVTSKAKEYLIDKGYDVKYGARPLRRTLEKYVRDEITEYYLLGRFHCGSRILVDLGEDGLVFTDQSESGS